MNEGGNTNDCDDYDSWEDLCSDEPDGNTDTVAVNSKFSAMVSDIHTRAKQNEIAIKKENQRLVEESDIEISKDLFDSAESNLSKNQNQQTSSVQIKNPIKKPKRFIPEPKPKPAPQIKKKNKKRSESDDEELYDEQDFQANDYYDKYDR